MATTVPLVATERHSPLTSLISDLSSDDGSARQQARRALIRQGAAAVPQLINARLAPDERTRLEAAKVLCQIADPRAAVALVLALEDSDSGVRWLAMNGLIALRANGLPALLHNLIERSDSICLREGAHRVVRELIGYPALHDILTPVLQALETVEPSVTVPGVALAALTQLSETTTDTAPAGAGR